MSKEIEIITSPYLPENTIFFMNFDIPKDITFNSIEEKLKWMAENVRLQIITNVDLSNLK